jgi:uncharacterized OsmC-like protein
MKAIAALMALSIAACSAIVTNAETSHNHSTLIKPAVEVQKRKIPETPKQAK